MKLIYLLRYWPVFGGGETVTRTLVNEMCKRDYDVTVIYLWSRTNSTEVYVDARVHTICLDGITNINDGSIKKAEYKVIQKKLSLIFAEMQPDIVINQWLPTKTVAKAMQNSSARLIKCHHGIIKYVPYITTLKQKLYYTIFGDKAGWMRVYPELKSDYLYSDAWVLLSEASKRDAKFLIKSADEKRMRVIPNPLSYTVDPKEININEKKKEVIYVGRIVELKRVGYLLEAWKTIEEEVPDWTFKVIGDGPNLNREKEHANELGLKRVFFEGFRDPKPYFMDASMLLMASNQEGFSLVLIEAQQCGCVPIVVDSFPTVHDIIVNDVNGVLVENNNIEKFAEAICELIRDEDKRVLLAQRAITDSQKFSVEEICDQWEKLFKTLDVHR